MSEIEHYVLVRHFDNRVNKTFNEFNDFIMELITMKYDINGASIISLEQSIMLAKKLMELSKKQFLKEEKNKPVDCKPEELQKTNKFEIDN